MFEVFRIIKGLSLEEHHGFNPEVMPDIFSRWELITKERWGLDVITYSYLKQLPNFERNKI